MTDQELIAALESLRNLMISVATGGPRINDVNAQYERIQAELSEELRARGIANPVTYSTLWEWYGRWSSGDLPSYQSRRVYVSDLVNPLLNRIRTGRTDDVPPTGWHRVDRTVGEIRDGLAAAKTEEQFQAVGLLCREALISLAQAVYQKHKHAATNGNTPSPTDAKRMLEAYVAAELSGGTNEETRKHARSALDLANALQHRRTASFRDAALCVEATTSVVNIVAVVAGKRDPADR